MSPVLTGIVKETLWCSSCHEAGREGQSPVYLVIWNSVLAGVEQDLARAEARLAAVDRLDLIGWLDAAQRESSRWKRRYHALFHDVRRGHEHLTRPPESEAVAGDGEEESAGRRHALQRLFGLSDEILAAPDPLAAILGKSSREAADGEDRADDGWW